MDKYDWIGVILFVTGLIGAIVTAMASDSGALTIWQVLILACVESLCIGIGGVMCD